MFEPKDKVSENEAIIALISDPIKTELSQRKRLFQAFDFCKILKVSNVYKREGNESQQQSELVVVLRVSTSLDWQNLMRKLSNLQIRESKIFSKATLLTINSEVLLLPGATLPDPSLVQDRLILQCAAEVWGDYEHPVMNQTLTELVKLYPTRDPIEFFSQGAYLY